MHTVWKGAISFGLVHVPVKMYTATEDKDIHFRSLHKDCGMPISYAKTCKHCDKEIGTEEIVKGYEYEKDKFVISTEEELESIKVAAEKTIKILDFVDLKDIDPLYFQKAYYLTPDMAGAGAYSLLLEAIKQTGKIGIAKISIRSKSSLAAIRVVDNCICMETMYYPDEIRSLSQVPNLPSQTVVNEKELGMAMALVEQLSEKFEPHKYTDDYRTALLELFDQKVAGKSMDVVTAPTAQGKSNVIDLLSALQASLDATNTKPDTSPPKRKRKSTAKSKDNVS
ncbi:Ku protein [Bacillus sp. FJAT-28004]|uniref:non-homologous end joining protein Ku n=1 Tax=Bacillus sp. FJAT-28004 TaxID=1679165 RepID=UPI0006B662B2|nr:Ku protein [Bacillus sp. FJAT-28004]